MKKMFPSLAVAALLLAANFPLSVHAATAGDLIKCGDFSSVYYLADDGERYVFPNEKIFYSWYPDFVDVKTISCADLASITLGDRVVYQAGTRLVKLPSAPTVYAVEDDGVLRPIASEAQAIALYGDDWAERVDDLSEAFWSSFTVGEELADDEIPNGTIITDDSGSLFRMEDGEAIEIDTILDTDEEDVLDDHAVDLDDLEERIGVAIALAHVDADQAVAMLTEILAKLRAVHIEDDKHVDVEDFDEDAEEEIDQVVDAGDAIDDAREEIARAEVAIAADAADGEDISASEDYLSDAREHLASAETAYGAGAYTDAEEHADAAKHAAMWARGKAVNTIVDEEDGNSDTHADETQDDRNNTDDDGTDTDNSGHGTDDGDSEDTTDDAADDHE